jgi:hypothetical protein
MTVLGRIGAWALAAGLIGAWLIAGGGAASAAPQQVSIGLYLSSIHDLDFANGKFTADFWVWTSTEGGRFAPLETATIVNQASKSVEVAPTVNDAGKRWDQRRVRADLWANWQVHTFPFDTQTLTIVFEDSLATTDDFVYVVDRDGTGIDHEFKVPGWTLVDWTIAADDHSYATGFGGQKDVHRVPRLTFTVTLQRQGARLYIDLCLGAFVAFGIMALSFRLLPIVPPIYGARMVIIVASMFTVVVSMRATGTLYAFELGETLPNRIHLATLAAGFLAALGAVIARRCVERGDEEAALNCDRLALPLFVALYLVIVVSMTVHALFGG